MSDFYVILTDAGQALMAAATAGGAPVVLSQFGVDDGAGAVITPDPAQTALINEVYRGDISGLTATGNTIKAQLVIPKDSGGYTVRGFGLYTEDGTLFSVCNFPPQEKPLPSSGYAVKMDTDYYLQVSDTSAVTLQFNGDDYLTREQADTIYLQIGNNLSEIAAAGTAAQQAARDNLALGTAATHDVQPDSSTTTPGTVPLNGGDIFVTRVLYNAVSGDPSLAIGTYVVSNTDPETGESINAVVTHSHTDTHMGEVRENGVRVYSPNNKPTADDVGALPIAGGQITGDLDVAGNQDAGNYTLNGNYLAGTLQVTLPACTDFNAAPIGYSSVGGSVLNGPTATIYGTLLTLRSTGTDNLPSVAAPVNGVWYQQMLFTTDGIVYSRAQTNDSPWTVWALQYSSQNIPPAAGITVTTSTNAQGCMCATYADATGKIFMQTVTNIPSTVSAVTLPYTYPSQIVGITCAGWGDDGGDSNAAYYEAYPTSTSTVTLYRRNSNFTMSVCVWGV